MSCRDTARCYDMDNDIGAVRSKNAVNDLNFPGKKQMADPVSPKGATQTDSFENVDPQVKREQPEMTQRAKSNTVAWGKRLGWMCSNVGPQQRFGREHSLL